MVVLSEADNHASGPVREPWKMAATHLFFLVEKPAHYTLLIRSPGQGSRSPSEKGRTDQPTRRRSCADQRALGGLQRGTVKPDEAASTFRQKLDTGP